MRNENWLELGEEQLEFRLKFGGETDAAFLKAYAPAGSIGWHKSQKHIPEFLYLIIGILSGVFPYIFVELLIVIIYGGIVDLPCLFADSVKTAADCGLVVVIVFGVFAVFGSGRMMMEGLSSAHFLPCP